MENEKGLDLSLAPPSGGSSYSLKDEYNSSSCIRPDEYDRGSKLINEFKNFLEGGNHQHPENRSGVGEKRVSLFSDVKHERETNNPNLTDKTRASHISANTDDGSTADNEDVADSELDGSTIRQVSQGEVPKHFVVSRSTAGSESGVRKEVHAFDDPSSIEHLGQKRFIISSEKEFSTTSLSNPYCVSYPTQPGKMANVPHSQPGKDSNPAGTRRLSGSLPGIMYPLATANSEQPDVRPVVPSDFPVMVGYTSVQPPAADNDKIRGILSHHQHSSYSRSKPINTDLQNDSRKLNQVTIPKSFESTQYDGRAVEHDKSNRKQNVGEQGSFSNTGGFLKGSNTTHQPKDASEQPRSDSFPSDFPAIRPGIAADLKFGGCGSSPNLPWVSTTGPGLNGRTISGVTYRYSPTQIRIVCACHGSHMSPEEFIQHASEENCSPYS